MIIKKQGVCNSDQFAIAHSCFCFLCIILNILDPVRFNTTTVNGAPDLPGTFAFEDGKGAALGGGGFRLSVTVVVPGRFQRTASSC